MTVFVIADTHFYHIGMLRFRHFSSTSQMNNYIARAWNSVVSPRDTVVHLGDFAYTEDQRMLNRIVNQLNGTIMLLRGNHDSADRLRIAGIGVSTKSFVPYENLLLSHEPVYNVKNKHLVNLHGHLHKHRLSGKHINACIDIAGYAPIPIQQYINQANQILRKQNDNAEKRKRSTSIN